MREPRLASSYTLKMSAEEEERKAGRLEGSTGNVRGYVTWAEAATHLGKYKQKQLRCFVFKGGCPDEGHALSSSYGNKAGECTRRSAGE